jgi:periplasmic protein TonB
MSPSGRLSGTLPVSVGVHFVALAGFLVWPLTSGLTLPRVPSRLAPCILAVAIPAPPLVRRVSTAASTDHAAAYGAPTKAPEKIYPEAPSPAPSLPDVPIGDASSVGDLGGIVATADAFVAPPPPPLPQRITAPVRVSELVQQPRKIADARPVYPDLARQARVEGTVILEAILDRTGRIDRVRVLRSVPLLDAAALEAVRQWRYTPTVLNGQPVQVLMTITINFQLQR